MSLLHWYWCLVNLMPSVVAHVNYNAAVEQETCSELLLEMVTADTFVSVCKMWKCTIKIFLLWLWNRGHNLFCRCKIHLFNASLNFDLGGVGCREATGTDFTRDLNMEWHKLSAKQFLLNLPGNPSTIKHLYSLITWKGWRRSPLFCRLFQISSELLMHSIFPAQDPNPEVLFRKRKKVMK